MILRPITLSDVPWISQALTNLWESTRIVSRGKLIELSGLDGFIVEERKDSSKNSRSKEEGRKVGLVTYKMEENECEIVSLNALTPGKGIGTALIQKVEEIAKEKGCTTMVVTTTNDNPKAVEFYQKRGFAIAVVRENIMGEYRKLKPEIPLVGNEGIPITDEVELEKII